MHTRDGNLFETCANHAIDLVHHRLERPTASRATSCRNDAVRAGFVAASLNTQCVGRATSQAGLDDRPARALSRAESVGGRNLGFGIRDSGFVARHNAQNKRSHILFLLIRNDADDARESGEILRLACCVTAGHDNSRAGILSRDTPDRLSRALIGGRRHRTGVDDHDIGAVDVGRDPTSCQQLFLNLQRIGLVHPTAEGDDGVLHESGLLLPSRGWQA